MIKAETIIHEGNPGPNWLEHCKAVFTPQVLSVLVIILAALALVVIYRARNHTAPVANSGQTSQVDAHARPLTVDSLTPAAGASAGPTSTGNLQPANSAGDAALPGTSSTASAKGTAGTASASPVGPAPTSSSASLQKVVTNSLQQTNQTVQSVVGGVKDVLPILNL